MPTKLSSSVEQGENPAAIPTDRGHLLDAWRYWADLSIPSSGSRDLYLGKLRAFMRFLAAHDPSALEYTDNFLGLNAGHIRAYLHYLDHSLHLSGATRLSHRGAVRSFCKFLAEDGYLKADPFLDAKIPRPKPDDVIVQPVAGVDLQALLRTAGRDPYLGPRDSALLSVLASTGLRVAELCAMTLNDVNMREGLLQVRHGKGNRARVASVEPMAMRQLTKYLQWRRRLMARRDQWAEPCDMLFVTRSGAPLTTEGVRGRLKVIAKRAGIDPRAVHPHVFRHSAATAAADAGMTIPEMNSLFGWARDSGMAERYSRTTTAMRAIASHRAIRPLERTLGG